MIAYAPITNGSIAIVYCLLNVTHNVKESYAYQCLISLGLNFLMFETKSQNSHNFIQTKKGQAILRSSMMLPITCSSKLIITKGTAHSGGNHNLLKCRITLFLSIYRMNILEAKTSLELKEG